MSSSSFWCHFCHNIVRISSSSPSLFCPSCRFGFVEEISNDPGILLLSGNPRPTDPHTDGEANLRDVASSRSPSSGRGFLRRLFRGNRSSRQAFEGQPSLLQVLEIALSSQRSRLAEGSTEGEDDTGPRTSLGLPWVNGEDNMLSRIFGVREEDRSSAPGITAPEGLGSVSTERPNEDMHAPRPLDALLQRLLSGILQGGRSGSLPASKAAIAAMPTFKIGKQILGSEACGDLDELHHECAVCKEVFELGGEVKEMPCKHFYHSHCILPWLELHSSCPLCRQEMPVDEEEQPSSSAVSEGTVGAAGGEPTIIFIGISGTGVLVFSFIMLGAGSRNEPPISVNLESEQGNESSPVMGEVGNGSGEVMSEMVIGNVEAGAETDERISFAAGQTLPSLTNDTEQITDEKGTFGKRHESLRGSVGHREGNLPIDGNLHVEECSNGSSRDANRVMSTLQDNPGPSNTSDGLETLSERRLNQVMSEGGQADNSSSGNVGRSFFSWIFRHAAARNALSSTTESSAESNLDCTTTRRDDLDENTG